ncbi:MAG: hypothetical protein ACHQ50_18170, partial [Fimbriimonadales bacterium]
TFRNDSDSTWPGATLGTTHVDSRYSIRLNYRFLPKGADKRKIPAIGDEGYGIPVDLQVPLPPGGQATLPIVVEAPVKPGDYVVQFDLVHELFAWFGDRGAASSFVPVSVGGPAPREGISPLAIFPLLVVVWGVLTVLGLPVVFVFRTPRLAPFLPALTPIVGFAVLSCIGHALASFDFGTEAVALPITLGALLLSVVAWRNLRPSRLPRRWAAFLVPVLVATAFNFYPIARAGALTAVGPEIDSIVYVSRAELLKEHGLLRLAPGEDFRFSAKVSNDEVRSSSRGGDTYALSFFSALTGLGPHLLFSVLMTVWYGMMCAAAFSFAAYFFSGPRAIPILAGVLAACNPLLFWPTVDTFFSQVAALPVCLVLVLVAYEAVRSRSPAAVLLAAAFLQLLASVYPAYLMVLGAAAVVWLSVLLLRLGLSPTGSRGQISSRARGSVVAGAGILVGGFVMAPVAWKLLAKALWGMARAWSRNTLGGNIEVFPNGAEILGLVNHFAVTYGLPHDALSGTTLEICTILLVALCGVAIVSSRSDRRIALA